MLWEKAVALSSVTGREEETEADFIQRKMTPAKCKKRWENKWDQRKASQIKEFTTQGTKWWWRDLRKQLWEIKTINCRNILEVESTGFSDKSDQLRKSKVIPAILAHYLVACWGYYPEWETIGFSVCRLLWVVLGSWLWRLINMVMDMLSVRSYAVSRGDVQWAIREESGVQ